MQIIDAQGRLFGYVNVVDALVVLLVGAVLLAGAAVVIGPAEQSSSPSAYATLAIDSLSEDTSRALVAAENLTVVGSEVRLPVVDAVRQPTTGGDSVRTLVRVRLPDDAPIYPLNQTVRVTNGRITYEMNLTEFGDTARIARQTRSVVVRATVSRSLADAVTADDQYDIRNRTVAKIDSVAVYPVPNTTNRRLVLTMTLHSVGDDNRQYLGQPVRLGSSIPFETGEYRFEGTIVGLGDERAGTPVDATLRVEWSNVRPELADAVHAGMGTRHRGATATITAVQREPATVVLRTKDGHIYAREHPVNEDVTLTVDTRARRQAGTLSFHGRPVQSGDEVVLDFGTVTVRGTVLDVTADG